MDIMDEIGHGGLATKSTVSIMSIFYEISDLAALVFFGPGKGYSYPS